MPDQTDNRSHPKSHENLGLSRQPASLSPNRPSPDPISGDYQAHVMDTSGDPPRSYQGLRNALGLIPKTGDESPSEALRGRQDYAKEDGKEQNRGKRTRTANPSAAMAEKGTVTVKIAHYNRLLNEIDRLRAACTGKHKKIESQEVLINSYQEVNQHVQFQNSDLEETVADLQRKLDDRENHGRNGTRWFGWSSSSGQSPNTAMKSRVHELEQEINAYRSTLANKDKEFMAARDEFTRELMEARALSTRINFKVSDDEIKEKWQELAFKVRQFVNCRYALSTNLSTETVQKRKAYCALPTMFLSHPLLTPLLFEVNVWCSLEETIFQSSSGSWAGEMGIAYNHACSTVKGATKSDEAALKEYHDWRSRSAEFINRLSPCDECRLNSLTTQMAGSLLWDRPKANSAAMCDIAEIIMSAAELDLIMRKSKAEIQVHFQNLPLVDKQRRTFNKEWMEERNVFGTVGEEGSSSLPFVDLIVSPVLTKRGDSNGDKYDIQIILAKADVVCNVLEAFNDEEHDDKPSRSLRSARVKTEHSREDAILPSVESEPMDTPMVDAAPSSASAKTGQVKSEGKKAKK